ncbi:PilZ domain-containing protein [Nitrospira sp. Kam-Ns4a]
MVTGRTLSDAAQPGWRDLGDERRELLRLDDRLLLEYRLEGDTAAPVEGTAEEAVAAFIGRPTAELLARAQGDPTAAPLVPWLMKLDWAIEVVIRALARINPDAVRLPGLCEVNVSGGGLRFLAPRPFRPGDRLALRFVLPPFVPIHAKGEVVRVVPARGRREYYETAVRFAEIAEADRERVIKHIVQRQAERLRARRGEQG